MPKTVSEAEQKEKEYCSDDISYEKTPEWYLKNIGMCFVGICFSQLNALGDISPFAVSFLCVLPYEFCFPCFLGSAVGYFIALSWQNALKYAAALSITVLFRLFLHKKFPAVDGGTANFVISFCSLFCSGLALMLFTDFGFTSFILLFLEASLGFCSSIFFLRAFRTPVMSMGINRLNAKDSVSLVLSLCIFLLCMSGFTIEGVSPARILSCLVVMFASLYKGSGAGAVTGVCVGAALCISPDFRHLFPAYALGGLLAGVFSPFGQIGSGIAFSLCYAAVCVISSFDESIIVSLIEVGISFAAFMIVPVKYISSLQDLIEKSGIATDSHITKYVSAHLKKVANSIYEVSQIVTDVSDRLDSIINPEINRLFASIQQKVCDGCENKTDCWNRHFDSTAADILSLSGIEKNGRSRKSTLRRCVRQDQLMSFIRISKREYIDSMTTKMKLREMRRVMTDQISGMGDFLSELADTVSESRIIDTARSAAIRTAILDSGTDIDALSYFSDNSGSISVEITLIDKPLSFDRKKVKTIIELMTKRIFENPVINVSDIRTTVIYNERLPYRILAGFCSKAMKGNGVCGDSVAMTHSPVKSFCALISDGMGNGKRAAVDSIMTSALMEKLLSAGFSFNSSLKIVNSALIAKSTDESLATVDGAEINLHTGKTCFYKSGAALSFVRKGNRIITIEKSSLPLGILRDVNSAKDTITMEAGDIILLVSDGVTANDCGWVADELLSWSTNSMDDLSRHIAELANLRREKGICDDITVLAIKLMANKQK